MAQTTYVFNVQRYSLHDGPGIRTIVFVKGCPMRCRWCCNPESQRYVPEILYTDSRCIGQKACGLCAGVCPVSAIGYGADGTAQIDRGCCRDCLRCASVCPSCAIRVEGEEYSVEKILGIVERDSAFFRHGGGGLTVSGGEPLTHPDFLLPLLREAKRRRIHTAIETCGYADYAVLREAAASLDIVLYDVKSMDEAKHREYTGCPNLRILENLERLCRDYPQLPKLVRTPVIPGFNDGEEELAAIRDFLRDLPGVTHQTLPYHRYGVGKYKALGRVYEMEV